MNDMPQSEPAGQEQMVSVQAHRLGLSLARRALPCLLLWHIWGMWGAGYRHGVHL